MNLVEMMDMVKKIYAENEEKYYYIGLRFEDKEREIGDECESSRHNADREDEREFPQFGSEEYEDLDVLDGTSAWHVDETQIYGMPSHYDDEKECSRYFTTYHCYVIAGDRQGRHDDPDQGEVLIKDAVVIAKIF